MSDATLRIFAYLAILIVVLLFMAVFRRSQQNYLRRIASQNDLIIAGQGEVNRHLDRIATALEARGK